MKTSRLPGDVMLFRSILAFLVLLPLMTLHFCFGFNILDHPRRAATMFSIAMLAFAVFFLRALITILASWNHPSARILRFSSVGLLLLCVLPVSIYVIFMIPPLGD